MVENNGATEAEKRIDLKDLEIEKMDLKDLKDFCHKVTLIPKGEEMMKKNEEWRKKVANLANLANFFDKSI